MDKAQSNLKISSKSSSKLHLPKINNTNTKNTKNTFRKSRANTTADFRSSSTSTCNIINSKRQSSSLPPVAKLGSSCLQHNGRVRSKTEIITSSVSYIGYSSRAGYGDKRRAPVSLKKRTSTGSSSPQRRWSTISEESSCSTRLKLSLKVPSSPQFQQVLQEIGN